MAVKKVLKDVDAVDNHANYYLRDDGVKVSRSTGLEYDCREDRLQNGLDASTSRDD